MITVRKIILYENYFSEFYFQQTDKVQEKMEYVFKVIRMVQNIPRKFLDHITGTEELFEISIEFERTI